MSNEIWKPVVGFEGLYEVSNLGRVRNVKFGRILKGGINGCGYQQVILRKNGQRSMPAIHRLVAQAFIPNPDNLPCVNHKDETRRNNCVENLEWCTQKYNVNYGASIARRAVKKSKPIVQLTKDGEFIREWKSTAEASRCLGIDHSHIHAVLNHRRTLKNGTYWIHKTAGGYKWELKTN